MVKPLGTVSHALETVWNPHWDTNRVSPCNCTIKPYNERGCGTLELMKLCNETMHWWRHLFHTKVSHLGNRDGETLTLIRSVCHHFFRFQCAIMIRHSGATLLAGRAGESSTALLAHECMHIAVCRRIYTSSIALYYVWRVFGLWTWPVHTSQQLTQMHPNRSEGGLRLLRRRLPQKKNYSQRNWLKGMGWWSGGWHASVPGCEYGCDGNSSRISSILFCSTV
jgi:hypothetical protein